MRSLVFGLVFQLMIGATVFGGDGPIATSLARQARAIARQTTVADPTAAPPKHQNWVQRHPAATGALVGAAIAGFIGYEHGTCHSDGCADDYGLLLALEFGLLGAAAGAALGALIGHAPPTPVAPNPPSVGSAAVGVRD